MSENINTLEPPLVTAAGPRMQKIILVIVACLYGALLLFLPRNSPPSFYNSPDEAANAFFAQGFAADGHLLRPAAGDTLPASVTPRSILRRDSSFIPVGLVSFPIVAGALSKLVGFGGIPFIFALFGILSIFAWYEFVRSFFGARIALLSAYLLLAHPFMLYWSSRPLFSNTLFLTLYIYALYFISRTVRLPQMNFPQEAGIQLESPITQQKRARRWLYSLLAGICFGVALALRPQEGIWAFLFMSGLVWMSQLRRSVSLLLFILTAALPIGGLLALQYLVYGAPWSTGYHLTPPGATFPATLMKFLLPFGFDGPRIQSVAYSYLLEGVWWFVPPTLLGLATVFLKKNGRWFHRLRRWALLAVGLMLWLLFFYGSFAVQDRFDGASSLGTSFTRYFLPLYVMATPLLAYGLYTLRRRAGTLLILLLIPLSVGLSLRLVFWRTDESLLAITYILRQNRELREKIVTIVPPEAVILTDRSDKIFFPAREVVTRFRKFNQPEFEELYGLKLYYETIADQDVVAFENERFWEPHGLKAINPVDLGYRHTLYRLEKLSMKN